MNLHEIETLLEKYFNGETGLEEETRLRDFFAGGNVPGKWEAYREYFGMIEQDRNLQLESRDFDRRVMAGTGEKGIYRLLDFRRPFIYWAAGVAASILILVAVFVKFDPFTGKIDSTYQDPQSAYLEARKILFFVSDRFNKGTSRLQPVENFDDGLEKMKPVAAYNQGVDPISRLDQVDKANKLISRN